MIEPGFIALRFGLAGHPLISEAVQVYGLDRPLVVSILLELIEAGLSAEDRGNLRGFDAEATAQRYGVGTTDVLLVLDALRVVGIVGARLGQGCADLHRQGDDQDGQAEGSDE